MSTTPQQYVQEQLAAGFTRAELETVMLAAGYTPEQLDELFTKAAESNKPVPAAAAKVIPIIANTQNVHAGSGIGAAIIAGGVVVLLAGVGIAFTQGLIPGFGAASAPAEAITESVPLVIEEAAVSSTTIDTAEAIDVPPAASTSTDVPPQTSATDTNSTN